MYERVRLFFATYITFDDPFVIPVDETTDYEYNVRSSGRLHDNSKFSWKMRACHDAMGSMMPHEAPSNTRVVIVPHPQKSKQVFQQVMSCLLAIGNYFHMRGDSVVLVMVAFEEPKPADRKLVERCGINIHVMPSYELALMQH